MEIPHDLRSLEAGRPFGTGRPSSLPASNERGTERSPDGRSDGAGARSADERSTDATARRSGAARRTRGVARDAEAETRSAPADEAASFEGVLARESAAADGTTAPAKPARDDAPRQPAEAASADGADELAQGAPSKRSAARGAATSDAATTASATTDAPADLVEGPFVALPHASAPVADTAPGVASDAEVQLTEPAGVGTRDTLSAGADEELPSEAGAPGAEPLANAVDTARGSALPLDAALPLAPEAHADKLTAAHAAAIAHVREPAGVRHASAEVAQLAPPPATLADAQRAADVLRQVRLQLVPELKSAVIQLAPAELGRVSIELEIDKHEVVARVRAEQPEALGALQRHLPELRAAFTRQGLETQRFEFALGFQDGQRGREAQQSSRRPARAANEIEPTDNAVHASVPLVRALAAGGVDTYA